MAGGARADEPSDEPTHGQGDGPGDGAGDGPGDEAPFDRRRFEALGAGAFLTGVAAVVVGVAAGTGPTVLVPFAVLLAVLAHIRRPPRAPGTAPATTARSPRERARRVLALVEIPVLVPIWAIGPLGRTPASAALAGLALAALAGVLATAQFRLGLAPPPPTHGPG